MSSTTTPAPLPHELASAATHNRLRPRTTSAPDCRAVALGGGMYRLEGGAGTSACIVSQADMARICLALESQAGRAGA